MLYFSSDNGTLLRLNAVDLNTVKRTGNYYANSNCSNSMGVGGYLQVFGYNDTYVKQVLQKYNGNGYYVRHLAGGMWSLWTEISITSDLLYATNLDDSLGCVGFRKYESTATSAPTSNGGVVLTMLQAHNQGMQMAKPNNLSNIYVRFLNAETWSTWKTVNITNVS